MLQVQAHGGGIIESDGLYYWFGESRKNFNGDKGVSSCCNSRYCTGKNAQPLTISTFSRA